MKDSLSHLPEQKQFEILRITEIIREVVDPEKIILFGSHAKGNWVEDRYTDKEGTLNEYISDYDILVVTVDNGEKAYVQESKILDRVDRYKPPVNLEIHDLNFINEGLEWGQYFFSDIVKEGILLFDKGSVNFAEPKELTLEEKQIRIRDYYDTWFPPSTDFITDAKNALARGSVQIGAFYLHQGAETLYYTVLLVFTFYKPKTHNLWKLRKKTKRFSKELFEVFRTEFDPSEKQLFELLKRGYVEARYKKRDYHITEKELQLLIDKVIEMQKVVAKICAHL